MDSRRFLWILVKSYPIIIKVGFLLGSASFNNKVPESNDKV